jgi:hypothetical protein
MDVVERVREGVKGSEAVKKTVVFQESARGPW